MNFSYILFSSGFSIYQEQHPKIFFSLLLPIDFIFQWTQKFKTAYTKTLVKEEICHPSDSLVLHKEEYILFYVFYADMHHKSLNTRLFIMSD